MMRLVWKSSNKIAGDPAELSLVLDWIRRSSTNWIQETLDWLVNKGPEPSWIELLEHLDAIAQVDKDDADVESDHSGDLALGAEALRAWRDEIAAASLDARNGGATETENGDEWTHQGTVRLGEASGGLAEVPYAFRIQSSQHGGPWSSMTLARMDKDSDWIRFEPQGPAPCRCWTIVSGRDWILTVEEAGREAGLGPETSAERGVVEIELEQRNVSGNNRVGKSFGTATMTSSRERFELTSKNLKSLKSKAQIRALNLSVDSSAGKNRRLRLNAKAAVRPSPMWYEALALPARLAAPLIRFKLRPKLTGAIDKTMATDSWSKIVELARAE